MRWTATPWRPTRFIFAYDSAAIRHSEQSSLQAVAAALSANSGAKLLIEGNCDERGTEEYNRSLGERRALAAAKRWPSRVLIRRASAPSVMAKTSRWSRATTNPRGRKIAGMNFVLLHPKTGV